MSEKPKHSMLAASASTSVDGKSEIQFIHCRGNLARRLLCKTVSDTEHAASALSPS
jgi:hypothetical protein